MNILNNTLAESLSAFPHDAALIVALSGGRDSVALLHAAHSYAQANQRALRALHINHQLQTAAAEFEAFCRDLCSQWAVPLQVHTVIVDLEQESSIEAAARHARYRVFEQELQHHEVLLIAQHQSDQAETFLLQALRGAGVTGLAAMPLSQVLGHGIVLRPWLKHSRQHIDNYIAQHQLRFINDPSNDDTGFKRNALRHDIAPALAQHFSAYEKTLARAAQHCAQADLLLDELAQLDAERCVDGERGSLKLAAWRQLNSARQLNLLRWWTGEQGARALSEVRLIALQAALKQSDSHRLQQQWDGFCLRCYREHVFILPIWPESIEWKIDAGKILAAAWAELELRGISSNQFIMVSELPEKIAELSMSRKDFLQWLGVPEWLRSQIPAIYINQTLCFYGPLWRSKHTPENTELIASGIGTQIWQRCCVPR